MERVNNMFRLNDEQLLRLKQDYINALSDKRFRSLIKELDADEDLLMKYTSRLTEAAAEFDNCKNCPGLSQCKNKIPGFLLSPKHDNKRITFSYNACHYKLNEKYKDNIELFYVPKAIKDASLQDVYTKDKNRVGIIKAIKNYLVATRENRKEKGIYLYGNFGCGKTYLIAALFNELAKSGVKGVIVHFPELLRSLKESFGADYKERFYALKTAPVLLLDDIGAEYLTAWGRDEVLEPILQYRMDENLPTFFTSNFSLEELEKHLATASNNFERVKAKRIIERIKQLASEIELISKNKRV